MKQVKRRLLSVVMALAILCTLVPSALAYTGGSLSLQVGGSATLSIVDSSAGGWGSPLMYAEWQWSCNGKSH